MINWDTINDNLTWSVKNGFFKSAVGGLLDHVQSKLANGFRDTKVKFYWDYDKGGAIYIVPIKKLVNGAIEQVNEAVLSEYKKLIGGDKFSKKRMAAEMQLKQLSSAQESEQKAYGRVQINNGADSVEALDDWGNVCHDALMLYIPVDKPIIMTVQKWVGFTPVITAKMSDHLVWYDTTALINLSSDKDLVLTRVTGRDYSRKELISNGDLNFSVSGHICSNMPDIYPAKEVQKFRQIMQYKGIIKVNNEFLDQWGVKKIVIKSFSLPSNEGNKSVQDYSFEAVGLQPDKEANVTEDTISIIDYSIQEKTDITESTAWKDILKDQYDNLKSQSADYVQQGLSLANGLVDKMMSKL